jgi:hypothetical protein
MCLKTIFALLAPKKAALSWPIEDTPLGKPQSAADLSSMAMSGHAQTTTPQSRLDHSQWLEKMQAIYNDQRQHPARLPLYRLYKATKWNGEKQARARQARVLVSLIFSGADHGAN